MNSQFVISTYMQAAMDFVTEVINNSNAMKGYFGEEPIDIPAVKHRVMNTFNAIQSLVHDVHAKISQSLPAESTLLKDSKALLDSIENYVHIYGTNPNIYEDNSDF